MLQKEDQQLATAEMKKKRIKKAFPFKANEVVLVKYEGELYYARILTIHFNRKIVRVLFDDNSKDEVEFENVHNGKSFAFPL